MDLKKLLIRSLFTNSRGDDAVSIGNQLSSLVKNFNFNKYLWILLEFWLDRKDSQRSLFVFEQLKEVDQNIPNDILEQLLQICFIKNDMKRALNIFEKLTANGAKPSKESVLSMLSLSVNFNSLNTALSLLSIVQTNQWSVDVSIAQSVIRLLWRFGRIEQAKQWVVYLKSVYQQAQWREIESQIVRENLLSLTTN